MLTSVTSGANSQATISLLAIPEHRRRLSHITWSYSAPPTGGQLVVTGLEGGDTFTIDVTGAGPGAMALPYSAVGRVGFTVEIRIGPGGADVIGRLNVLSETV